MVERSIAEIRSAVTGELTGRSKLVDHLLDLRLESSGQLLVTATIDRLLVQMPGRTAVPNAWVLAALAEIERAAAAALTH